MKDEKERILVVDDNLDTLNLLSRKITAKNWQVLSATNVEDALGLLQCHEIDIILTDYRMPNISGLDFIRHLRSHNPDIPVIMITGYPSIEGAVEAVKVGAEEYLSKPFTDEELCKALNKALAKRRRQKQQTSPPLPNPYGFIGSAPAMQELYSLLEKTSRTNATVLLQGESGTGKELAARAIHYHSRNSKAPFVPVNCSAIPENLLEAELFGYLKGAFTGAVETRAGYFLTADGGSIFLDEISETPLSIQVKLLRVLQDKQVYMIGSKAPRKVNVRIIAATNKNLTLLVKQGRFRDDLFFRLNVLPIDIPPLKEHPEDITLLVEHFLHRYAKEISCEVPRISDAALKSLMNYAWPGNVRELENLIYRLVILCEGKIIDVASLPDHIKYSIPTSRYFNRSLRQVEAEYIQEVLISVHGNKSKAATILGIDRKTLYNKMKEYNLETEET